MNNQKFYMLYDTKSDTLQSILTTL